MLNFIKKHWKGFCVGLGVILAGVAGLLAGGKNIHGGTEGGLSGAFQNAGGLAADQQTASRQNTELGKTIGDSQSTADGIASDNRQSSGQIDRAQAQLDKLGADLGIK